MATSATYLGLETCSSVRLSRVRLSLSSTPAVGIGSSDSPRRSLSRTRAACYLHLQSRSSATDSDRASFAVGSTEYARRGYSSATRQGLSDQRRMMSVKDLTQYVTKVTAAVDIGSVSRVLASLNLDVPKQLMDLRRILPSALTNFRLDPRKKTDESPMLEQSGLPPKISLALSEPNDKKERVSEPVPVAMKYVDREQHNFTNAMTSVHESVSEFLNNGKASNNTAVAETKNLAAATDRAVPAAATGIQSSVKSTLSTVYTGITRQIAEYMPGLPTLPTSSVEKLDSSQKSTTSVPQTAAQKVSASAEKQESLAVTKKVVYQRKVVARASIDRLTHGIVHCLREAKTCVTQLVQLKELCQHIVLYPDCTGLVVKAKATPCLLSLSNSRNSEVAERAREALALIGYVEPVRGRGVNVLCLDGGGTKGLVIISILKRLEEISNRRIYEMFDYVCGVSTGSLIGILASVYRVPIDEIEDLYKEFSVQMFERNRLVGAGKLFMSHAYYDTQLWEGILRANIGEKTFLETARDPWCPKLSAVSTLVNNQRLQNHLFRNYNLPPSRQSHYLGSSTYRLWEAIRASSAAPGYFEECQLGDWIHQDGGLLTNNPTAIAIHECKQLWPDTPLQCVVSIGTGKYEPTPAPQSKPLGTSQEASAKTSLKHKVIKIVESATDTEAVHTVLLDLLPASGYFRFNPYMSEEFLLDEIRASKWLRMKHDTEMYCRKNEQQLERVVKKLAATKRVDSKASDWVKLQITKFS